MHFLNIIHGFCRSPVNLHNDRVDIVWQEIHDQRTNGWVRSDEHLKRALKVWTYCVGCVRKVAIKQNSRDKLLQNQYSQSSDHWCMVSIRRLFCSTLQ